MEYKWPFTASQQFDKYNGLREGLLRRAEQYARWTIPKIFPEINRSQDVDALVQDFQALGAQAVNSLANRLMMSLFAPSRPFFRLALARKIAAGMSGNPDALSKIENGLSTAEREAAEVLDRKSIRSRMYDLLKYLIVTGNALMLLEKDTIRILSLRNYVVKRNVHNDVVELIIKEKVHKDSVDPKVRALCERSMSWKPDDQGYVWHFHWAKLTGKSYLVDQWIGDIKLPAQYSTKYAIDRLPYRAVTWDLATGDDYGTGLVEDFAGDFVALSTMSRATIQAAVLASEFRWLVNPTGMTSPDDFEKSANGAALPGAKGDIELVQSGVQGNLQVNLEIIRVYVNRIGAGFMLQSAVTRDSERTTAYEIKKNAEELEGGLGGAYSRIAVDVQMPLAYWSMEQIDKSILGSDVEPTIITGLAALSRTGDRDRMLVVLQHFAGMATLPPPVLNRMRLSVWMNDIASSEGLQKDRYFITDEEYAQQQELERQSQINAQIQQGMVQQELQPK
jgi:hypothetical protein